MWKRLTTRPGDGILVRTDVQGDERVREPLIVIMDGQGGGIGRVLAETIRTAHPELKLRALGTNALATAAMLKGGAGDGATGENAVVFNAALADIILGPVGILTPNGLLGEVTPKMAEAVGASRAVKILLPSQRCSIRLAVGPAQPMQFYLQEALRLLEEELGKLEA